MSSTCLSFGGEPWQGGGCERSLHDGEHQEFPAAEEHTKYQSARESGGEQGAGGSGGLGTSRGQGAEGLGAWGGGEAGGGGGGGDLALRCFFHLFACRWVFFRSLFEGRARPEAGGALRCCLAAAGPSPPCPPPPPQHGFGIFWGFCVFSSLLSPPFPCFPPVIWHGAGERGVGDTGGRGEPGPHPRTPHLSQGAESCFRDQPGRTGTSPQAPPSGCPSSASHTCERLARRPSSLSLLFLAHLGPDGLNKPPKKPPGAGGRAPAARRGCVQVQADLSSRSSPCIPLRAGGSLGDAGGGGRGGEERSEGASSSAGSR
ncbi:uncharacterized protein LOC118177747 [Oxyura jamaicensis]|uniref:uncharacterized protein LOC118177747 n=1 Tax=Oxyura jamaicensis TaxID=8884 RepID=UPI0015A548E5|nr:uncharacterized protein LOC118177747 [Oxyura jamaicensis]